MRAGDACVICHQSMGGPQVSPLSPILFMLFIQDLLDRLCGASDAGNQAFADDIIAWLILSHERSGREISLELEHRNDDWSQRWQVNVSATKCNLMVISRTRDPPTHMFVSYWVFSFGKLGFWIDSMLIWGPHIHFVTQKATDRLRAVTCGLGTMWGLHPTIVLQMVDIVIITTLLYALFGALPFVMPLLWLLFTGFWDSAQFVSWVFFKLLHWNLPLSLLVFSPPNYKFDDH